MAKTELYPLVQSQPFDLGPAEEARIDLYLKKPPPTPVTKLKGSVLSCAHDAIAGATVKVLDRAYNPVAHTLTDAKGRYVFNNVLPPGFYKLTAAAQGYLTAKTKDILLKEEVTGIIDFALKKDPLRGTGVIYGLTLDALAEIPLSGTSIVLLSAQGKPAETTISNEQGQYLFSMVPPGQYVLKACKDGYTLKSIALIVVENAIIKCDIFLDGCSEPLSGTISGLIKCESRALADAVVGLYRIDGEDETLVKLETTNSEGLYLFTNVGSGHYRVKSKPGKGETYQEEFRI